MALPYSPDPESEALIADTSRKRQLWRSERQNHEQQWFISSAFDRGQHYIEWNDKFQRLMVPPAPPHRIRIKDNRIQAKNRARFAKFTKNRPKPIVVPATNEYDDYLNARATQKTIDYLWRKLRLEQKYRQALLWARNCSKGFWWYHWNPTAQGRVLINDPVTGQKAYQSAELGDIEIEVGSPFELLVADPGCATIADQPEIMRIKLRELADMQARYPEFADYFEPDSGDQELFRFERQIATLNPLGIGSPAGVRKDAEQDKRRRFVLVTEHFIRPCGRYPKGHYRVLVGKVLVKAEDELPYGFWDLPNPYPVTEFADQACVGQFWPSTLTEQMIDLQKEFNLLLSKVAEHIRVGTFPKIFVPKQAQLAPSAWTTEAGELIEYVAQPNIPPPTPYVPPPVTGDLWNMLNFLSQEFDVITQIWPAAEGQAGGATSGFQTNLLQEAAESVHEPDIRNFELSIEESAYKLRRMMKLGYTVPRIIATVGPNYEPEVYEFSAEQIDEFADIIVEAGSGLPTLKAQRQETVMNLFNSGILGDVADPEVRRRALSLLELGSVDEGFDLAKQDENQARWETKTISDSQPQPPQPQVDPMTGMPMMDPMTGQPVLQFDPVIEPPHFWENHLVHYNVHTAWLKSPEGRNANPLQRRAMIAHVVLHARFVNPQSALQIAMEEGITEHIPMLQALVMPATAGPAPAGPETPQPSGPPQEAAPPPGQAAGPPVA